MHYTFAIWKMEKYFADNNSNKKTNKSVKFSATCVLVVAVFFNINVLVLFEIHRLLFLIFLKFVRRILHSHWLLENSRIN